jgi:anti-sigma B factor antagonist
VVAHPYLSGDGAFAFDYARFTVDHVRGCAVVVATGEIDLGTSPRLCEALDEAGQESDRIIIDLTDVTFLDSSGMAAMVKALNRNHHRQRGTLCLVGPTGVVLRALEVTDLVSLFPIYSSCDEALGHLA